MRVVLTPRAVSQLESLHRHIATRSGEGRADAYIGRIQRYCRNLGTFPARGTRRDDLMPGLRVIGFERRATILFTVGDEVVLIEGIYYGGQDYEAARDPGDAM